MKINAPVFALVTICSLVGAAQEPAPRLDQASCSSTLLNLVPGPQIAISAKCSQGPAAAQLVLENRAGRESGTVTSVEVGFCGGVRKVETPRGWRAIVRTGRLTTIVLAADRPGDGIGSGRRLSGVTVHFEGHWSWASEISYSFSDGARGGAMSTTQC